MTIKPPSLGQRGGGSFSGQRAVAASAPGRAAVAGFSRSECHSQPPAILTPTVSAATETGSGHLRRGECSLCREERKLVTIDGVVLGILTAIGVDGLPAAFVRTA